MIFRYKRIYLFRQGLTLITAPITFFKQSLFPLTEKKKKDFPDFLVIGAHKSGTTWLYENLRAHPDLFLPETKEVHYFDWNFFRPLSWYLDHFKNAGNRIKGEITPAYAILSTARIRHIRRNNPGLKIIFVVRDPIQRAWSHALNNYCIGMARPYEQLTAKDFEWHFNSFASIVRSDYAATMKNWSAVFASQNIHLCFYQDLKNDPEKFLQNIFEFLDVETPASLSNFPFAKVINKGPAHPIPPQQLELLKKIYYPKISKMSRLLGDRCFEWMQR